MNDEHKKEGVSVKELEGYAKKHRLEVFFCLLFIIASLFTLIFWGATLSIFFAGAGGVVSVLMPQKIETLARKVMTTIFRQEKATVLIVGIAILIAAMFLAPLIFLLVGLHAGKSMIRIAKESSH